MAEYIFSEPLKKEIADFKRTVKSDNSDYLTGYICALSAVEGMIAEQPVADVEPVTHAEWEYDGADRRCSNCGAIVEEDEWFNHNWYYCYHCGAKMGGEENGRY